MSLHTLIAHCLGERDPLALARSQAEGWQSWLQPITPDSPVGEDPGYDDDFQRMREEVNKLSGADVEQVVQLAEKLLTHSCKDLRVATYYLWARLQKDGEAGLADGLSLLAAMVERFATEVLPVRANSRKLALEWLASGKVLDSLSRHPEVVRSEAERTVAALAWLEHGLEAWPHDQRPALGALYGALSARLTQSGGVDALVPQHSAHQESDVQAAAPRLCHESLPDEVQAMPAAMTIDLGEVALTDTERDALIKARIGQSRYRDSLVAYWGGCSVTECSIPQLLRASHIKPWRSANHAERLDQFNGLLLTPNLDLAFDQGLISFDDDGDILLSTEVDAATAAALHLSPALKLRQIEPRHRSYLTWHRENLFRN